MRSSVSMQHTSDEELLCASLMRNSREIKAFFNTFSERNWMKLLQYLALIGIRSVQHKLGAYSSLESIKELMDNLSTNPPALNHQNAQNNQQDLIPSSLGPYPTAQPSTPSKTAHHEDVPSVFDDESRYKPSSRWRKGERQGVQFSSVNEDHFVPHFPEKPSNIQASPIKPTNHYNITPQSYLPTPSSPFFDDHSRAATNVQLTRGNVSATHPYFNSPVPHVHDYFNPYQNSNPYHSYPVIPPTTYVHYPSYPSHPLNAPTIVHHLAPQQPQLAEFQNLREQPSDQNTKEPKSSKRTEPEITKQQEEIAQPENEVQEEPPKAVAWSTSMSGGTKKKKAETPKKEAKKPAVKKLQRHASVPPKFGVPYDLNKVESKIKGQIMVDKKTNSHTMHEPVLVTSKKETAEKHLLSGQTADPVRQERVPNQEATSITSTPSQPHNNPQQLYSLAKQSEPSKLPPRNMPSKRLEEILYQKKKVDSPRTEKQSVLSIVEKFMNDPYLKDFY